MKKFYLSLFFVCFISKSFSQKFYQHEFGINAGFYQLRSDYGINEDSETNFGNQGTAVSLYYYLNMASRRDANYFFEHFKYRLNLSFASVNLQHYGPYVNDPRLAAMTGKFQNIGIGNGLEYHPFGVKVLMANKYYSFLQKLSPFAGFGVGLNFVSPTVESSLPGGIENPENIFPTFVPQDTDDGINQDDDIVASLNLRLGIRLDFNRRSALMLESSWMLFGSDLVDGLSPIGPQNQNNDWSWGINVGYSYLLF